MPRAFVSTETLVHTPPVPTYPEDLLPELQRVLAALADLDLRYEVERDHLEDWSGPEVVKQQLVAELEQSHTDEREPYAVRLAELKQQIVTRPLCGFNRIVH
jgi:hypothetical protein